MRKYFFLLLLLISLVTSCDTEQKLMDDTLVPVQVTFDPPTLESKYKILVNGSLERYVANDMDSAFINIISLQNDAEVLKKYIKLKKENIIIQPVGSSTLDLYLPEIYKSCNPNIEYLNEDYKSRYSIYLGDNKITNGISNYILRKDLPETIKIVDDLSNKSVYSQEFDNESNSLLNLLQLSEDMFLMSSDNNQTAPANNVFKIRFFYPSSDFPNIKKMNIHLWIIDRKGQNEQDFASFDLEPNTLSNYLEVKYDFYQDGSNMVNFYFDLTDDQGNKIVDHKINKKATVLTRNMGVSYSFITFKFFNSTPNEGLSVKTTPVIKVDRKK